MPVRGGGSNQGGGAGGASAAVGTGVGDTAAGSASALRRSVEDALQQDLSKVNFLRDSLAKSQQATRKVGNILTSFGDRLSSLEGAIRPLRQESMSLTRGRDNLQTVARLLDDVLEYYDASQKVDGILQEGPKYQLETYIDAMRKVSAAREYFVQHNPDNPELMTLTSLRDSGVKSLESEFRQVLERHSFAVSAADLQAMSQEQVVKGNVLPEDVTKTLRVISGYLAESSTTEGLCKRYTEVRCGVLQTTLSSFDTGSGKSMGKKHSSTSASMHKVVGKGMRRNTSIRRRKGESGSQREETAGKEREATVSFLDMAIDNQPGSYERGSHPYLFYVKAIVRLLQRETSLANKVLPEPLVPVALKGIFSPALDALAAQSSLLAASAGRQVDRQEFFSLAFVFDAIYYFKEKQEDFEGLLMLAGREPLRKYNCIVIGFADVARRCLVGFEQSIQKDNSKKLPFNGTVHEATSNTLSFLSTLHDFAEIAGNVLRGAEAFGSEEQGINWVPTATSDKFLARWIALVLLQLCANLSRKAKAYESQPLSSIFLINNYDYIMRTILQSGFADLVQQQEQEFQANYRQRIETQRQMYRQHTWAKIDEFVVIEPIEGTLSKRDREVIKEKYAGFNQEFEDVIREQQQYSIPNEELREELRRANLEYIVPRYKQFDLTYRHSGFTSKNPQKYLRFTPDEVMEQLGLLFDD
eukprot:m.129386 g.129386  ORF g.129386 m.129386 type:complete len:699 (+) comp16759_c0_seq6:497-2593(+)